MAKDAKVVKKGKYNRDNWNDFLEKAQERRGSEEIKKTYDDYEAKFIESMRNQAEKRKEELDIYLTYYKDGITIEFFNRNYITLSEKHIKYMLSRCKVMVITANPIEKAILHHKIVDNGSFIMTRFLCETTAYYVFKWGKYWIAHIHQSQTGSGKDMGTNVTIGETLKLFTPNIIISLGIAFGIDYETQDIGDVLVSRRILPYSENKRDEEYVKPDRTQDKTIDDWLYVRLENAIGFFEGVTCGDILSGGSVMSSCQEKDRVCLGYTKADFIIGGEMEGNAVFQYAKRVGIPGVVIKGICDWGIVKNGIYDGEPVKDEKLKDSFQVFAMMKAVEKCEPLFNDKWLFSFPKNINIKKLIKNYHVCLCVLIASQLLMIMNGICRFLTYCNNRDFKYIDSLNIITSFFELPIIWFIIPLVYLLILLIIGGINFWHKAVWRIHIFLKRYFRK